MANVISHGWMRSKGLLAAILVGTGGYGWLLVATGIPHGWMGSKGLLAGILVAIDEHHLAETSIQC